jgi:hypothetical protein
MQAAVQISSIYSSVDHALFQARLWRGYAMDWDGVYHSNMMGREWVEKILRVSRDECVRRSRQALEYARIMNQK